jgi:hypothetical protein
MEHDAAKTQVSSERSRKERGIERRGRWHDRLIARLDSPDPSYRQSVAGVLLYSGWEWPDNEGAAHEARLERLGVAIEEEPIPAVRQMLMTAVLALTPGRREEEIEELYQQCGGFSLNDPVHYLN